MKKYYIISLVIIIVSILIGAYFYPSLPEQMASHWNIGGKVDGYMPRFWGVFLMPIISIVLYLLFLIIPKIDPLKKNILSFQDYFGMFIVLLFLFLLYLYALTLAWNMGYRFELIMYLAPAFAVLFYYAGILTQNAKKNWFIGIRTPWTLSSDTVWHKTNTLGGKLFKATGIICLFALVFPSLAIWFILIPIIVVAVFTIVYSYILFKKEVTGTRDR